MNDTSVVLFMIYGGLMTFFGATSVIIWPKFKDSDRFIFMNPHADQKLYGETPRELMARIPMLKSYRNTMLLMLATGLLVMAVTWFGVRAGQEWAL